MTTEEFKRDYDEILQRAGRAHNDPGYVMLTKAILLLTRVIFERPQ